LPRQSTPMDLFALFCSGGLPVAPSCHVVTFGEDGSGSKAGNRRNY